MGRVGKLRRTPQISRSALENERAWEPQAPVAAPNATGRTRPMTALASRPRGSGTRARGAGHVVAPLVVTLLAAGGVVAIYRFFVGTSLGQLVDTAAMRGADVHHPKVVAVLERALN